MLATVKRLVVRAQPRDRPVLAAVGQVTSLTSLHLIGYTVTEPMLENLTTLTVRGLCVCLCGIGTQGCWPIPQRMLSTLLWLVCCPGAR